ncbi:uncharacterized protein LOC116987678 [Amblyraja radiata]|uniref:uncharacterized protein LOC116987678 n=1 Tax=Amblyraja radiata TaxID=386614 RepID=UPI001403FF9B|nr:uncharacterized protein LOC116987678 [Amblyraja radiata]XP_032899819.1 uncharacterized protein LOC116987678 [Amblyraja radiata]
MGRAGAASPPSQRRPTWLRARTLCKMHPPLWIITVFLPAAATALDIEDIQMPKTKFVANEGDRLLIPCSFKADEDIQSNNLRLEWGVIKMPSGTYRAIYRVVGSVLEPVPEPNPYEGRAQMFISLIPRGNCSLVLQPLLARDTGLYELRLYSEGEMTVNGQKVEIIVDTGRGVTPALPKALKKSTLPPKERSEEEVNLEPCSDMDKFDRRLMSLTKGIKSVSTKTGVSTLGLEIIAGVVTGILLFGTVAGVVLCCHYHKGLKSLKFDRSSPHRKARRHRRRSHRHSHAAEEPAAAQQEEEVLKIQTPDPTTSSSPMEPSGYQVASDTNSTLFGFDMANSN